jgi:nucleolar GTP-binding protein
MVCNKYDVLLQYTTYKHIKERFGDRLWIDVISKCDLLGKKEPITFDDTDEEVAQYRRFGPEGALPVSVQSEIGIKEVSYSRASLIQSHLQVHSIPGCLP